LPVSSSPGTLPSTAHSPRDWARANAGNRRNDDSVAVSTHSDVDGSCTPRASQSCTSGGVCSTQASAPAESSCTAFSPVSRGSSVAARTVDVNGGTQNATPAGSDGNDTTSAQTSTSTDPGTSPSSARPCS
jgi:hypothetical protein